MPLILIQIKNREQQQEIKLTSNQSISLSLNQEHSVYVVTMLPLRWVTVRQCCCLAEPWNLPPVLPECPLNENISANMSSNMSPPKELWKCLLCLLCASSWDWKWLSKCLLCWECGDCPNTSKSLKMSSKLKLNGWWGWPPLALAPSRPKGLLLIWSYSCLLLLSDNVSYAEEQSKV